MIDRWGQDQRASHASRRSKVNLAPRSQFRPTIDIVCGRYGAYVADMVCGRYRRFPSLLHKLPHMAFHKALFSVLSSFHNVHHSSARNLGFIFDEHLSFMDIATVKSSYMGRLQSIFLSIEVRLFLWILIALLAHICVLMLSRDAIIGLRSVDSQLSAQVRSAVTRAGCGRRGCRAGQHVQRRKNAVAYIETGSTSGIPAVSTRRRRRQLSHGNCRPKAVLTSIQCHDDRTTYRTSEYIPTIIGNRPDNRRSTHRDRSHHGHREGTLIDIRTKPHWSFPNLLNANVRSITSKVDVLANSATDKQY